MNEKDKEVLLDPEYSQEDWLCDLPMSFEWILPVGKISPDCRQPIVRFKPGRQPLSK